MAFALRSGSRLCYHSNQHKNKPGHENIAKVVLSVRVLFFVCGEGDSNPYAFRYQLLRLACLPIPPLPRLLELWQKPALIGSVYKRSEDLLQKVLKPGALRVVEDLVGGAFLYHFTAVHEDYALAYFTGKTHFMGDYDHGHAGFGKLCHYL